jgi:hypothetical protein
MDTGGRISHQQVHEKFDRLAEVVIKLNILGEDRTAKLREVLALPRAAENPNLDPFDRWLATVYTEDSETFRPTSTLEKDYRQWCKRKGERALNQPAFYAELKKRPWLREGKTRWPKKIGKKHKGHWGLRP